MLGRWSRRSRYPKDLRDAGRPDDPLFERPLVHGRIDSGVVTVRRPGSDEIEVYHVPAKRKGDPKVNAAEKRDFDTPTVLALLDEIERLRREREAALDILSREDIGDGAKVEGARLILKGGDRG